MLAYLGGVMTGRAQWASSLEESRAALARQPPRMGKRKSAAAGEAQTAADAGNTEDALVEASVLAASELRFSRALRAEPGARLSLFRRRCRLPRPQTCSGRGPCLSAHASGHAACRARGEKGAAANAHRHI